MRFILILVIRQIVIYFNPRIRGECDLLDSSIKCLKIILIRAPVWSAIFICLYRLKELIILIRVPVWGTIYLSHYLYDSVCNFNPRTREECDPLLSVLVVGQAKFQSAYL